MYFMFVLSWAKASNWMESFIALICWGMTAEVLEKQGRLSLSWETEYKKNQLGEMSFRNPFSLFK